VFNGEIYNFRELRVELTATGHRFVSQSDTEVVLHAYLEWGTGAFDRFMGMFAIAIYDRGLERMLLVRDYAGMKPLYYSVSETHLVFASEVRAFGQVGLPLETNDDWPVYLLSFGHLPEPFTTLRGVQSLPAGHYLTYDLRTRSHRVECFTRESTGGESIGFSEACTRVRSSLECALRRHLITDAPLGLFLSGGIDSSSIVAFAQPRLPKMNTFSLAFDIGPEYDERRFIAKVRERYPTDRASYHVSASLERAPLPQALADADLPTLLEQFDARQVLHVTFGSVLTARIADGRLHFYDDLMALLRARPEVYAANLEAHFLRHLTDLTGLQRPVRSLWR
jgi:asparagine synthase (glutamine-hydrolysing)